MEFKSKLALPFIAFGGICGVFCGLISGLTEVPAVSGLFIAALLFFISYKLTPGLLRISPQDFPEGKWVLGRALKHGFWSFFASWFLLWILVYTLVI